MAYAHSCNSLGNRHELVEHLNGVAALASKFAEKFGAAELGRWAGLWHDLGKFHPEFQQYLDSPGARRGPDHKGAGASLASRYCHPLTFLIAGHHGGLHSKADLKNWLRDKSGAGRVREALALAESALPQLFPNEQLTLPPHVRDERSCEFFIRMLFSALVDADFLDTERHFDAGKSAIRPCEHSLSSLWPLYEAHQNGVSGKGHDAVSAARHEVYLACLAAAERPQGVFRLTVPTGGGKTLSAMGFALRHALRHGLERVIVAIPFTSIIEQTSDVYRGVFGDGAVLEHHSAVAEDEDTVHPSPAEIWRRLAAENWDAPIVVTTTVRLFESLFGHRTSTCRKLHNIARSVLVLDEVQTLPPRLLEPIIDGLKALVEHYGVTVVLCTATQPALDRGPYLNGFSAVQEIVPESQRLFQRLKRVRYERLNDSAAVRWDEVAEVMRTSDHALAIVNTKRHAMALLDALNDPEALHLSTLMCGAHRRDVLREVRERLKQGGACRLVSTQVVEAGVDLDFPLVLRAVGPLDSIVQAAGRCNREGRLDCGRVIVFKAAGSSQPRGAYATGTATAAMLMQAPDFDFHDPAVYQRYFEMLYGAVNLDAEGIQEIRQEFNFPEVSQKMRLIEQETVTTVVTYPLPNGSETVRTALAALAASTQYGGGRRLWRALQPYVVNVWKSKLPQLEREGLVSAIVPGLWRWHGMYDNVRGIVMKADPDSLIV